MSSFSSSPSKPRWICDVFLITFRMRSRYPSIRSLESSLREAGLLILSDDGFGSFWLNLGRAIEESRMVIVVFTEGFHRSILGYETMWEITERYENLGKMVVPVFYGVDKEEIVGLGAEMIKTGDQDKVFRWRRVLQSGWTLSSSSSRISAEIRDLTNFIKEELVMTNLALLPNQVGIKLRVKEVLRLSNYFSENAVEQEVTVVGIWGVEGIGKTTLARSIYDAIGVNFKTKSFLANISREWEKDNGPVHLQEQLISDINSHGKQDIHRASLRDSAQIITPHNFEMGIGQIERILHNKRALIVLDDVREIDQLMGLCESHIRFCSGSMIFITTRYYKNILDHCQVVYEMKKLDKSHSLELFSGHAFKQSRNRFTGLSEKVVTYCEGIPLVLEVLGSLLFERGVPEWQSVLKKLEGIPNGQIKEKLKISYDYLDDMEKNTFYNLVCFYVGKNIYYAAHTLYSGIDVLIERSLVKIDTKDNLYVHDLLQEIGRGIETNKSKPKYVYNVFLSFRGEDTRKSFATHLYTALKQAGIEVFMDDEGIERGESISSSLLQAIESSRMSVIIFSKNYAGSSWCLQELEKIMECHRTIGQEVLPIFYDVRPSEVRKQHNAFGEALEGLIMRTSASQVKKLSISWTRALSEAANLSGWDLHNYRTETELIDDVIEAITMKLDENKYLFVAHHPVGLKSRVQDIIQLLSSKSSEVIIAGMWGMGGIGKTTIAKAIYNEIGQIFEGKSFLTNIREVWKRDNGQVYLQEQLLSGILKTRKMTLPSLEMGKSLIKETLPQKRVLVVLDDVNNEDQLKALCGSREWFGRGSRIIITTRDERLLKFLRVVHVYNMKEMDDNESLELFSWHAFKQATPERDFVEVSRRVVSYSGGLPLALEILGSYLFDREIPDWESVLEKLQQIPNDQIYEKLKISYDGLSDHTERDIFLDICCFFIGKDRNYATQILNSCGFHAEIGITRLMERSLVKVDNKNKLDMHDLLRDMGREIIREQSPEEPEKRTRLWFHDDVLDVLRNSTGTIVIKGLTLSLSRDNSLSLNTKAFKKMKRLRLLQLNHVKLAGDYEYLSKELRWFCWHGFPLENIPVNLSLEKIVALDLKCSNLIQIWERSQLLEWLKILNLSHSHYLTKTPDFSKLPYLEKLMLKDCRRLSMVHPSIGDLKYIVLLNLKDCKDLSHLPRSIYNLTSLKTLNLYGCSKIEKLEEGIGQMKSLTTLMANQTAITQVPLSLVRSKSIKYVSLCGYEGLSHDVFPSLIQSWISPTNNPKSLIQAFAFRNLQYLIQGLSHHLLANSSGTLQIRPRKSQASCRKTPALIDFHEQDHMERSETFMSSLTIHAGGFNNVMDTLLKRISQGWNDKGYGDDSLPKDSYPDWLNFNGKGSSVLFKVPQISGKSLKGLILCIVYLSPPQDGMTSVYPVSVVISNHSKATFEFYKRDAIATSKDEEWHNIIFNLEPDNEVEVIVIFACKLTVKMTSIYLVYDDVLTKELCIEGPHK